MYKPKPKILVLSGYGLNCEEETAHAFELAGGQPSIVHVNDLIKNKKSLAKYQMLAVPGGFSYGDDTGSGKAYANKLKNHLQEALLNFAEADKLIIGICNGFQILTQTGLLPGNLIFNAFPRYTVRWVDLKVSNQPPEIARTKGRSNLKKRSPRYAQDFKTTPWLYGINSISLPIAHGEGKFFAGKKTLSHLQKNKPVSPRLAEVGQIAFKYYKGEISKQQNLPANPNGSLLDIAGITGYNGRVLGMMPHPERAVYFTQATNWTLLKEKYKRQNKPLPKYGPGLQIFKNAVNYFKY